MAQLKDLIVNGPSRFAGDVMLNTAVGTLSGSNASVSPDHALLISGYNRADDSSGDTWIYWDALGGSDSPWGIKHNQTDNVLDFFGAGDAKSHINLATGTHSSRGFVHKDYCSSEYALTSNGGVAHIPSMSVNYANTAGSATDQTARDAAATAQSTANGKWTWNASDVAGVKVNNAGYADSAWSASVLNISNHSGSDGLQYMQFSGANDAGDNPSDGWSHIIKMNHGNGDTYFNRTLAFDFFSNNIYTRSRIQGEASDWKTIAFTDSNVASADYATTAGSIAWDNVSGRPSSLPANGGNADTVDGQHFSYSNDADAPTWLWATNESGTSFVARRANLSVNYANSASSATYDSNWNHIANTYATKGEIPSVGNGTITITQNGTSKGSFTLNQSGNATIELTDTNTHPDLSGYATQSWVSSNFNYSTDSWRPITDSYSGSEQGTSLSQYGANALYNALVNGYAAEAGYASSAGSANSVAWSNVSGRPTSVSQFTNDSGYATQSWVSSNFNYSTDSWRPIYDGVDSSATDTSASANAVRLAYGRADSAYNLAAGKQDVISDLSTIRSQASNGNTAYGWGNHASAGYFNASNVWNNPETVTLGTAFGPTEMYNSIQGFINNGTVVVKNGTLYVMDNPSTPVSTHWLDVYSDPQSYGGVFYEGQIILDLYPDRFYDLTHNPLISTLTINSISGWNNIGLISHNIVRFKPGSSAFTLTLPSGIYWANGNPIECDDPDSIYEISFIKRSGGDEITATWTKFTQA